MGLLSTSLEFILLELPRINIMDNISISYKLEVLLELKEQVKQKIMPKFLQKEVDRLIYGNSLYYDTMPMDYLNHVIIILTSITNIQ